MAEELHELDKIMNSAVSTGIERPSGCDANNRAGENGSMNARQGDLPWTVVESKGKEGFSKLSDSVRFVNKRRVVGQQRSEYVPVPTVEGYQRT